MYFWGLYIQRQMVLAFVYYEQFVLQVDNFVFSLWRRETVSRLFFKFIRFLVLLFVIRVLIIGAVSFHKTNVIDKLTERKMDIKLFN